MLNCRRRHFLSILFSFIWRRTCASLALSELQTVSVIKSKTKKLKKKQNNKGKYIQFEMVLNATQSYANGIPVYFIFFFNFILLLRFRIVSTTEPECDALYFRLKFFILFYMITVYFSLLNVYLPIVRFTSFKCTSILSFH